MREINQLEKQIIAKKQERLYKRGITKSFDVQYVEYHKIFPRNTLAILSNVPEPSVKEVHFGITLRGKNDEDIEAVGEIQSFIRALNAL